GYGNVGALARGPKTDRKPNAARGAGDEQCLAGERRSRSHRPPSNMQRMSERGEHRLVEGFTHRRMDADRQGEPKGGGRFKHPRPGGGDPRNTTVYGPGTARATAI